MGYSSLGRGTSKCCGIPLTWGQWAPRSKREPWGWLTLTNDPHSWFGMALCPFNCPLEQLKSAGMCQITGSVQSGHGVGCTDSLFTDTVLLEWMDTHYLLWWFSKSVAKHLWTVHLTACRQKNFTNVLQAVLDVMTFTLPKSMPGSVWH